MTRCHNCGGVIWVQCDTDSGGHWVTCSLCADEFVLEDVAQRGVRLVKAGRARAEDVLEAALAARTARQRGLAS